MKGDRRYIQGYNAQAVVNEQQIVLAAEITTNPTDGRYSFTRRVLATDHGNETYRKRQKSIEPVFGHTKHNRRATSKAGPRPPSRAGRRHR